MGTGLVGCVKDALTVDKDEIVHSKVLRVHHTQQAWAEREIQSGNSGDLVFTQELLPRVSALVPVTLYRPSAIARIHLEVIRILNHEHMSSIRIHTRDDAVHLECPLRRASEGLPSLHVVVAGRDVEC